MCFMTLYVCFLYRSHDLLANIHELESLVFQKSVRDLINKENGFLVVDDELISSRAKDVEVKTISNRKTGKEGPVSDCVSCSLLDIMYGMRLRTSSVKQKDNVMDLIGNLPDVRQKVNVTFDRGYGKRDVVDAFTSRGFDVTTFAATVGSRHPFLSATEVDNYKSRLARANASTSTIQEMSRECEPWIFDENEHLGSEVRIASLSHPNRKTIYAASVREVFDRKVDTKMLRFFLTGDEVQQMSNTWICVPKKSKVQQNTLFDGVPSSLKYNAENRLLQNCNPLTIGQRCADWFLMRTFHLTGTVGASIGSLDQNISDDRLNSILNNLTSSWFNRFPSSKPMKIGSKNENSVMMALRQESFVKDLFEVGLLEHGFMKYVAVSPDGVVLIQVRNSLHYACVEVKTRVSDEKQIQAMAVFQSYGRVVHCKYNYGRVVHCKYNDFRFKSCVPSDHRGQVLHQAMVTGFFYG